MKSQEVSSESQSILEMDILLSTKSSITGLCSSEKSTGRALISLACIFRVGLSMLRTSAAIEQLRKARVQFLFGPRSQIHGPAMSNPPVGGNSLKLGLPDVSIV